MEIISPSNSGDTERLAEAERVTGHEGYIRELFLCGLSVWAQMSFSSSPNSFCPPSTHNSLFIISANQSLFLGGFEFTISSIFLVHFFFCHHIVSNPHTNIVLSLCLYLLPLLAFSVFTSCHSHHSLCQAASDSLLLSSFILLPTTVAEFWRLRAALLFLLNRGSCGRFSATGCAVPVSLT